jgi:glutathione S-transferase
MGCGSSRNTDNKAVKEHFIKTKKPKLMYFNANGRGANIRAILCHSGITWEDERIAFDKWPELKTSGKIEWEGLPALEIDGKILTQSLAIEIYLGRKLCLLGETPDDEFEVISLLCTREDLIQCLTPVFRPSSEEEKTHRNDNIEKLRNEKLPWFLKKYEARLTKRGGKYVLGDKISLADIFLAVTVENVFRSTQVGRLENWGELIATYAPKLHSHIEELKKNELSEYFSKYHVIDSMF